VVCDTKQAYTMCGCVTWKLGLFIVIIHCSHKLYHLNLFIIVIKEKYVYRSTVRPK